MTELALTETQRLVLEFEDALEPLVKLLPGGTDLFRIASCLYRLKRSVGLPGLTAARYEDSMSLKTPEQIERQRIGDVDEPDGAA